SASFEQGLPSRRLSIPDRNLLPLVIHVDPVHPSSSACRRTSRRSGSWFDRLTTSVDRYLALSTLAGPLGTSASSVEQPRQSATAPGTTAGAASPKRDRSTRDGGRRTPCTDGDRGGVMVTRRPKRQSIGLFTGMLVLGTAASG